MASLSLSRYLPLSILTQSPDMTEGETGENAGEESAKTAPPSEGDAHSLPVKPAPEEASQPSAGDTVDDSTSGGGEGGRAQDNDKKKRRRQDGGSTSDSGKKSERCVHSRHHPL